MPTRRPAQARQSHAKSAARRDPGVGAGSLRFSDAQLTEILVTWDDIVYEIACRSPSPVAVPA